MRNHSINKFNTVSERVALYYEQYLAGRKLIIFIILLFSVPIFAVKNYTKDIWFCELAEYCELSDYTGKYTKNCQKFDSVSVYWEYAYDKFNRQLFCHSYDGKEKQCTKIVSNDTDRNIDEQEVLIIKGETIDYIFGDAESYGFFNIIFHSTRTNAKLSHDLCQPLHLDFDSKKSSKKRGL